jgi:hypothetical protein
MLAHLPAACVPPRAGSLNACTTSLSILPLRIAWHTCLTDWDSCLCAPCCRAYCAGDKCLDVGCGIGGPLREIALFSGAHVTGKVQVHAWVEANCYNRGDLGVNQCFRLQQQAQHLSSLIAALPHQLGVGVTSAAAAGDVLMECVCQQKCHTTDNGSTTACTAAYSSIQQHALPATAWRCPATPSDLSCLCVTAPAPAGSYHQV